MLLGIDVGGTSIKYGIIEDENSLNIVEKGSFPTDKSSPDAIIRDIADAVNRMKDKYGIAAVGIGVPGFVDHENGMILETDNLPFDHYPAGEKIMALTGLPAFLDNDANCAALGENRASGGRKTSVLLTLGTGVGGGITLNGKLYTGNGLAGEIGHMTTVYNGLPCVCGRRGCLEQYASATALARMARQRMIAKPNGQLAEFLGGDIRKVDGKSVFEAVRRDIPEAKEALDEYCGYLASGIESLIYIFDPDEIVLGGGITGDADLLLPALNRHFNQRCAVRVSALKNNAGFIGAALLSL